MALRCFLFSSDEETAELVRQVLSSLGVEGEFCPDAVKAVERITNQAFQIVIIDWDQQPEAGLLLSTARERKASERPITLAIVSDDSGVPKALQAGANSILRKPIVVNQAKDTLTTARDLIRSRVESAVAPAAAAAAAAHAAPATPSTLPSSMEAGNEPTLRAGEFLQSMPVTPGGQFETESDASYSSNGGTVDVDPLKDLEPMAAAVAEQKSAPAPAAPSPAPPAPGETRGLEWYLKARGVARQTNLVHAAAATSPRASEELLGYEQMPSQPAAPAETESVREEPAPAAPPKADVASLRARIEARIESKIEPSAEAPVEPRVEPKREAKEEAALFAHIDGQSEESEDTVPRPSSGLGKRAIIGAAVLAACAVIAAPQAPWHPQVRALWRSGAQSLHTWLNPQLVTPTQAPATHEDFGRAGDEYKLPVAENIPDATTDPSQIKVLPVIDPTAKKTTTDDTTADQSAVQDGTSATPGGQPQSVAGQPSTAQPSTAQPSTVQSSTVQPSTVQPSAVQPSSVQPATGSGNSTTPPATTTPASAPTSVPATTPAAKPPVTVVAAPAASSTAPAVTTVAAANPAPVKPAQPRPLTVPTNVPSSLKSQISSMTPDASGNKSPDSAMPSIEPVSVTEVAERSLLTDQPAIAYPPNANGQQGTVILQVLVGRDGSVQDAKFLQGSLAFARAAIDGVRQWKFKPYTMNGHSVSIQTQLTLKFKPS